MMPRLKKVLKISAWVSLFIVAVVYLQRYGIGPLQEAVNEMGFLHRWDYFPARHQHHSSGVAQFGVFAAGRIAAGFPNGLA